MSELLTTPAIVLRSIPYSDSSKIATLLTRDAGKISVIAKGAKSQNSRYGHLIQPLNELEVVVYLKSGRDIQNLTQASFIAKRNLLLTDYDRMMSGFKILDWGLKIQIPHNDSASHFTLFSRVLTTLDTAESVHPGLFGKFFVRLSQLNGYEPNTFECGNCGKPFRDFDRSVPVGVNASVGQIFCESCQRNQKTDTTVETPVIELISHWLYPTQQEPPATRLTGSQYLSLEHMMENHLRYHLDL